MAKLFEEFDLTVNRLTSLLLLHPTDRPQQLLRWRQDDARHQTRAFTYTKARAAIVGFHSGRYDDDALQELIDDWRQEADVDESRRSMLLNNVRALKQYLAWNQRKLDLLPDQTVETNIGAVKLYARPHMYAMSGELRLRVFIDNRSDFNERFLETKCEATFWIATQMRAELAQVEIEHAAQCRIVARVRARESMGDEIRAVCALVESVWRNGSAVPASQAGTDNPS